jgi:hypothetical protein
LFPRLFLVLGSLPFFINAANNYLCSFIRTGYGLDDWGVGVRVPVGSTFFSFPSHPAGFGVHPNSYLVGTGAFSPEVKRSELEVGHSPPASAEVKKMWIYTFTPPYAFMAYFLIS